MPDSSAKNENGISYSLEIFPPKDPNKLDRHWHAVKVFCKLKPQFVSVTCGAFGNIQNLTKETCLKVRELGGEPAPHITCLNKTREEMLEEITDYKKHRLNRVVALRGDYPKNDAGKSAGKDKKSGGLSHAAELINMLVEVGGFDVSAAAYPEKHPESGSLQQDIQYLKEKLDAGASRAITQFFLDPDVFLRFRDKIAAAGINKPIIPGILPILNISKVRSFAKKCGVTVPPFLLRMYEDITDDALDRKLLAMNILSHQITRLAQEGVRHFHFYTLNDTLLSFHICRWIKEAF